MIKLMICLHLSFKVQKKEIKTFQVHTALSEGSKSYQVCTICNLGPKDLNDFDKCKASANLLTAEAFKRSISVLHAWIRSMEYMLNLAYRLVQVYFNNYTFYTDSR